jgi:hypothetical protein
MRKFRVSGNSLRGCVFGHLCFALAMIVSAAIAVEAEQQSPPPLPFHSVEGVGGAFSTSSAYLVNPAKEGDVFGLPSIGGIYVHVGNGRHLAALTVTETLWDRLELGYAWDNFDMGDLPQDIERATSIRIRDHAVDMHNFNARVCLVKDGEFDQPWLPAITLGGHYKLNDTLEDIDADLMGTLTGIGIAEHDGFDYTLSLTKMVTFLPRPLLLNATVRATEAAHIGLLGFTDDYEVVVEGSVCALLTDRFILAGEYRQKPDEYDAIPGLVGGEDDWWTICAGYIVNDHMTISGGYAHFGELLNHVANSSWGVAVKYEF